jgi:hypothetical protein
MNIRNYLKYFRIISLIRSIRNGEVTRKEILIAICAFIALRVAIYFSLHHPNL